VLVVADQQALRIRGEGGLASAGQAEEDGGVLAVEIGVGGAVHGGDALERQIVVHHGEHALFHLAAVPGVEDDLLTAGNVEGDAGLGVDAQLLVVLDLGLGGGVDDEVRLKGGQLRFGRLDEHVLDEMSLPGHFHDEADGHAGVLVGAAEGVDDEQALAGELLLGQGFDGRPGLLAHGMVVVLVLRRGPPDGVLGVLVHDDVLVLGGAAGINAGHDIDGAQLADLALFIAFQLRLHLFRKQHIVGGVADDFRRAGDTVFAQVQFRHCI